MARMKRIALFLAALLLGAMAARAQDEAEYGRALARARAIWQQTRNAYRTVALFRSALAARPDGVEAWRGIGAVEALFEQDDEALFHLTEAVRLGPEDGQAWFWLGVVHRRHDRKAAAWGAFERATRFKMEAGNEKLRAEAVKAVAELEQQDPDVATDAHAGEEAPGPPAILLVRYLGASPRDANMRDAGDATMRQASSVDAGRPLDERLLRVVGLDAAGFPALYTLRWSVSAGLKAGPPIAAGDAPSRREEIVVQDGEQGIKASTAIAILGPATGLAVLVTHPEIGPGQRSHLEALITDAAGNLLYHPLTQWTAAPGADGFLIRPESGLSRENDFEPHRNIFALPADQAPAPAEYVITCTEPTTGLKGMGKVRGLDQPAAIAGAGHGAAAWEGNFEHALAAAAKDDRMVLVDFSADW